jgi:general secretion pathway protein D
MMSKAAKAGLWVVAAALFATGCASSSAYRQGQREAKKGNWDGAVAKLTMALEKSPDNIGYKIALENARVQASRQHYLEARKHMAADELDQALDELEIATKYDGSNKSAADDLQIVRAKIDKREEERKRLADYDAMKARAQARRPVATLSPRSPVPITLRFGSGTKLQKVLDTLGKLAGVNILYDDGFQTNKEVEVNLTGVTFQEALDQLMLTNRLFYRVVDQNSLIIVPESPQKRRSYEEAVMRTFYLQNAETTDVLNLIKSLAQVQKVFENKALGTVTIVASPDKMAMAERIIDANDKAKGEVLIEVRILEVDKVKAKEYGIRLSNYEVGATLSPTGAAGEVVTDAAGNVSTNVRAHLLSSLNMADWIVSIPAGIFAKFLQSEGSTKILASPRLRAAEGKKTTLRIGEEIPIPVTSFTTPQAGTPNFGSATSFQYRNVGVNLELTPKVNANGDITLDPFVVEFSVLGSPRNVGGGLLIPSVITRNVSGTLRLRDSETSLLGGLVSNQETMSRSGALGFESIPLLNRIFGANKKDSEDREVLISITPHVVRAPKLTDEDLTALAVGTEEVVRVRAARPSLFAEEPVPETPAGEGAPPAGARPGTVAPQAPTPAPAPPPSAPESLPESTPPSVSVLPRGGEVPPPREGAPTAAPSVPEGTVTALFSPPEAAIKAGANGTLALVLVGVRDLRSVEVSMSFDPKIVQAVEASAGSLLTLDGSAVSSEKALEAGKLRVRFTRTTGASGSGVVTTLTFKGLAPGTAEVMAASVTLTTGSASRPAAIAGPGRLVVTP